MKDLTVSMADRPGTLADVAEALGKAGVNIEGFCGFAAGGEGTGHVLVEDAGRARSAIEGAGATVSGERDVLVLDVENKPGALGAVARKIADAGVNVEVIYVAGGNRIVIGANDLNKARAVVS